MIGEKLDGWALETVRRELATVDYGAVVLKVHEGRIISIDTENRRRVDRQAPIGRPPQR